jgi:hypothetical protein
MCAYKCSFRDKRLSLCENNVVYLTPSSLTCVLSVQETDLLHLMNDESLSFISSAELCAWCVRNQPGERRGRDSIDIVSVSFGSV